jgi:hypothetical protein
LVRGAWAGGSSWIAVIKRLQAGGYAVAAPQFPRSSIAPVMARVMRAVWPPLAISALQDVMGVRFHDDVTGLSVPGS